MLQGGTESEQGDTKGWAVGALDTLLGVVVGYGFSKNDRKNDNKNDCQMKIYYYKNTDSLYLDLSDKPSVESQEVSPGVVLDYDDAGQVCGIDFDYASQKYDLSRLELEGIENYLMSVSALVKDWLRPEEDEAWKDL